MLFRTTKKCSQNKQKKLKVSEVLAQLDTDVLIREVMGAIKVLVLDHKKNNSNYRELSCQIQQEKTLTAIGWYGVFPPCFHVWPATSIISFDSNQAQCGSSNQNICSPKKSCI